MNRLNKSFFLVLIFLFAGLGVNSAAAQGDEQRNFGNNFVFELYNTQKKTMVREPVVATISDTAIYRIFDNFKRSDHGLVNSTPKSPVLLGVKLNPSVVNYYSNIVQSISKEYPSYIVSNGSAILIAMGINAKNVDDYRYHVVENDSVELVPWSPIPKLAQKYGAKQPYGFLGEYNAPGKRILIEVVNRKDYSIRDGVIFDWRVNFMPVLKQITVSVPYSYFNLAYKSLNRGYATKFDKTGIPLDFKFPADSVQSITFQFRKQETLVHAVYLVKEIDGKRDTTKLGFVDSYGYFSLYSQRFATPGHYEIVIQRQAKEPDWNEKQLFRIPFDVLPPALFVKKIAVKELLLYAGAIVLLFVLVFVGFRQYTRRKFNKARQQRTTAQLKLKTIRSQLNPHFMFNALSSIQNLMNKNALLEANHYLSKFARLTRKVLDTSEQEMISLEEELKLTEDYLQMEQLRFGFQYRLDVAENLDIVNIDLPAMLLQPFIENAIKHGIALLKDKGLVVITVLQQAKDLVLVVKDNGKGFNTIEKEGGNTAFGLKLSRERINLLNQIYKDQPASLTVESGTTGTTITITLRNWI